MTWIPASWYGQELARRTDDTYAELLRRITARPERAVRPGVKRDIEAYYADLNAPITTKRHRESWESGARRTGAPQTDAGR